MFLAIAQNDRADILADSSHPKPLILQDAPEGKTIQKLYIRECQLQQCKGVHQKGYLLRAQAKEHANALSDRTHKDSPHLSAVSFTRVIQDNLQSYQASDDQNQ